MKEPEEHQRVKKFFGSEAGRYRNDAWFETPVARFGYTQTRRKLFEFLQPEKTEKILEIGCGPGTWTKLVAPKCMHLTSIDISEEMLREAKRYAKAKNVSFVNADFSRYNTKEKFDKIYFVRVFEYFKNKDAALRKLHSMLKKDGKLVIIAKSPYTVWALLPKLRKFWKEQAEKNGLWVENISAGRMEVMLKDAGFRNTRAKPVIVRLPIFKRANFNIGIIGRSVEKPALGFFSWLTKVSDAIPEQINLLNAVAESYAIEAVKP